MIDTGFETEFLAFTDKDTIDEEIQWLFEALFIIEGIKFDHNNCTKQIREYIISHTEKLGTFTYQSTYYYLNLSLFLTFTLLSFMRFL